MTDNKNVPKIIENSGLALHKTRNLLSITDKILARKTLVIVDKQKLLTVLCKIMDARFRMGHLEFKTNARYILDEIRDRYGNTAADSITICQLKASYNFSGLGLDSEEYIVKIKSIEELYKNTEEQDIEILPLMLDVMETAFKLGYMDFKENAKFVVDAIRKQSAEAANLVAIHQLKAGYINYSQSGEVEGTTQIQELTQYNSIEDIYA